MRSIKDMVSGDKQVTFVRYPTRWLRFSETACNAVRRIATGNGRRTWGFGVA